MVTTTPKQQQQTIESQLRKWIDRIREAVPMRKAMELLSVDHPGNIRHIEVQIAEQRQELKKLKSLLTDMEQEIQFRIQGENKTMGIEKIKVLIAQEIKKDLDCIDNHKAIQSEEFELEKTQADLRAAEIEWQKARTFAELVSAEMIMLGGR